MSVAPNGSSDPPLPRAAPPHGFPLHYATSDNGYSPDLPASGPADFQIHGMQHPSSSATAFPPPIAANSRPSVADFDSSSSSGANSPHGLSRSHPTSLETSPPSGLALPPANRWEMPADPHHLAALLGGTTRPISGVNHAEYAPALPNFANHSPADHDGVYTMESDMRRISYVLQHRRTLVAHLRLMLRDASLVQDGVKKEKIARLLEHAAKLRNAQQSAQLHAFRMNVDRHAPQMVNEPQALGSSSANAPNPHLSPPARASVDMNQSLPSPYSMANAHIPPNVAAREQRRPGAIGGAMGGAIGHANGGANMHAPSPANPLANPLSPAAGSNLIFRMSPFYTFGLPIRPPIQFRAPHATHKVSQQLIFTIDAQTLSKTPNHVFLAAQEVKVGARGPQPMAFPFYTDIQLDGYTLSVNTRGVRGAVGSAKPVDLRPYLLDPQLLKKPGDAAPNAGVAPPPAGPRKHLLRVTLTINDQVEKMSTQSFKFGLFYGTVHSNEELLATLTSRPRITQHETKELAMANAQPVDEDIMSSDAVLSLKDKIMFTRIRVPIRSRQCTHIDCFDADSFLMLQAQAETWKCPVCNQAIQWEDLAVDDFFTEILSAAGPDADTVVIKPDGQWSIETGTDSGEGSDEDSDDDWLARREANRNKRAEKHEEVVMLLSDTEDEDLPSAARAITPAPRGASSSSRPSSPATHPNGAVPNGRPSLPNSPNTLQPLPTPGSENTAKINGATDFPENSGSSRLASAPPATPVHPPESTQPDQTDSYCPMPEISVNRFISAFCAADSGLLGGFPKSRPTDPQNPETPQNIANHANSEPVYHPAPDANLPPTDAAPPTNAFDDDVIDLTVDD